MTLARPEINTIVTRARTDTIRRHASLLDWERDIFWPHLETWKRDEVVAHKHSYSEYLASPHWQALRVKMLERARYKCEACQDTDSVLHVHHLTYERLGCELEEDLIVLCEECHKVEHGLDN